MSVRETSRSRLQKMAEGDEEEYEVKDEELVDFEGSDYGFESEEEVSVVENTTGSHKRFENERPAAEVEPEEEIGKPLEVVARAVEKKEGVESGEIEEEKDEKEGVVVQPPQKNVVVESRQRKQKKADLEDGELDDAAMVIIRAFLSLSLPSPFSPPSITCDSIRFSSYILQLKCQCFPPETGSCYVPYMRLV